MYSMITFGLDVGDRFVELCALDAAGEVLERGRLPTRLAALEARFKDIAPARVILETGKHSPWISRALQGWAHEVIVANARRVHLISREHRKSDRSDAETLARLGRLDPRLLKPIQHRGAPAQADLSLVRARDALVRSRTLQINVVRGLVKSAGGQLPKCSAESFPRKSREAIPAELAPALFPLLETIGALNARIAQMDQHLEELAQQRYPETALLRQVTGVGALTALTYLLVLEDPRRFPTSRSVGAYLGLVPRRRASGDADPQLRITKTGDRLLRRLLVQSAQYILGPFGPDSELRRYGERIALRGGSNAKKRAVVAVARKLSALLYALWTTGAVYEPLRQTRKAA